MIRLCPPARLAGAAAFCLLAFSCLPALHAQAPGAPEQAAAQALELLNSGRQKEAADAYAAILKNYPTSSVVPEAQFRLGYLDFLLGDYDASIETLKKVLGPPAPPELQELAASLMPQAIAAKATKLKPEDPKRKTTFEEAIKSFDAFLQKYPRSDEAETANYGRALASYQIAKYDDATRSLRENLSRFPKSESILDSQYLLALTLATQGSVAMHEPNANRADIAAKYDEALKLLGDIVAKRGDVALANDAQFQIGEVLFSRAGSEDAAVRGKTYEAAIAAYRAVQGQEVVTRAQEARVAGIVQRIRAAGAARDTAALRRLQSLQTRELTKLQAVKGRADQTLAAQIKVAASFFLSQHPDEARVLLHHLQPFAADDDQKKQIAYYMTMSYAAQNLLEKAVASYDEFQAKYKGDPIAENLPLVVGSLFLNAKPPNPAKAAEYFKQQAALYPKSSLLNDAMLQEATSLMQLKRYDEALASFKKFLATNPRKELAAQADFNIGSVLKDTGKLDDAIAKFREVRDKYAGTPQGELAAFWVGQLLVQKGDVKNALPELQRYVSAFPQGAATSAAMFAIAQAQAQTGDKAAAMKTYADVAAKFPKSEAAPFSYFQRAALLAADNKVDEMIAVMRDFIAAYPESDKIFAAYDAIGQNQVAAQKPLEAVATYREMADKHPENPQASQALYVAADLLRRHAESLGRYIALNETQRADWNKDIAGSVETVEKLLKDYPDSPQVALALQTLLQDQKLLTTAKLKTPEQTEQYFQALAKTFDAKPATRSKVLFTLAAFLFEKDKAKAIAQMQSAYDPKLVYAPADLDLFGGALIDAGKPDDALALYQKLAQDFPVPPGTAPDKAPPQIAEAQATAIYGIGRALQVKGKVAEAAQQFDTLKKLYPWSPKILEANYGIAQSLVTQNKLDEAMTLLIGIIRAQTATAELRANSFLLAGKTQEQKGAIEPAIDYFIKIAAFYEGVPAAAAEGLWRGGQLLEKQAAGLSDTTKPTKAQQMAKAAKAYKDLTEKYPASEFAAKAKERLGALGPAKG